jgi:diguanylate cyclase (GGDEF)-like protein/PAS domain S-box-containing protein
MSRIGAGRVGTRGGSRSDRVIPERDVSASSAHPRAAAADRAGVTIDVTDDPAAPALDPLPDPAASVDADEPFSPAARAELITRLFARYPDASVTAIAETGRFVPWPADAPLGGQQLVSGHDTALELVAPEEIVAVIEAWKTTTVRGASAVQVRPLGDPDGRLAMYFVDMRERYGVFVGMFVTADGSQITASRGAHDQLRPRLTVVRKTRVAEFVDVDDAFTVLLGHGREEIVGRSNLDLVHPDDHPLAIASWVDLLGQPGAVRQARLRHRHADGHWIWFEVTNRNLLDDPAHGYVLAEMIDISDEMAAQESLRASQQLLARLTDALPVGVVQVDHERRVVYTNARAGQILASRGSDTLADMFAGVVTDDLPALNEAWSVVLDDGVDIDFEVGVRHPRRNLLRCRLSLRPLTSDDGVTGAIACIDDITEPARLRAQLEFRASYDALTGCLNRASLLAELDRSLDEAGREGTGTAVVFIDLDGFKSVNDTRGHTAGDALLQEIACRLTASARRGDVVGRVGGDEFLVIGHEVRTAEQALAIGQRLADGLAANVRPQPPHPAVASIGVAWSPGRGPDAATADQLVGRADDAMYASKRAGNGRPVLHQQRPTT